MEMRAFSIVLVLVFCPMLPLVLLPLDGGSAQGAAASPVKWVRYAQNPILTQGAAGSWESTALSMSCVINDSGTYRMWYSGGTADYTVQKTGYATSADGKSWTKYAGNPVLSTGAAGSWDSAMAIVPCVVKDNSTYKMWYGGYDGSVMKIGYATSTDCTNWTKYAGNPVLGLGGAGAWDDVYVYPASVILENGTFKMWYGGYDGVNSRLGFATSTDGTNWTKYASNPVLGIGANGAWDDLHVTHLSVQNVSGKYQGWYGGNNGFNWGIGYATSSDGLAWTKHAGNPVMARNGNGWEKHDNMDPVVIYDASGYRMWYIGVDNGQNPWVYKVGYAEGVNTPPDAPALTAPGDNVWTSNNKPTFSWSFSDTNAQDSQTAFQVQLDGASDFGSVDHDSGKVSSAAASYTPAAALPDGVYYWRARVWDTDGDSGSWSVARSTKIDATPPSNPGTFSSASHTTSVWSNDDTIDIGFGGAADATSGLSGYSIVWDYASGTLPDASQDIDSTVSSRTSPAMSDSKSIHFHIRAIDKAGNIAAGAAHFGPFYVDATPPLNPAVTSTTHTVGNWTNSTICNVSWSGADGSISGVNGYSALWDAHADTLPDEVKDHEAAANNSSSTALSDGSWYFHIRTRDEAGNWAADAAHLGPVRVDSTPPFNPDGLVADRPVSKWNNVSAVTVQWSGPNGAVSGVDGFSYGWDASNDTLPDETKDCEEAVSTVTSPSLADGDGWYFHLRTRDNAGNWNASAVHLGPFWVDSSPPADPVSLTSGSHAPYNWSNDTTVEVAWTVPEGGGRLSGYDGFSIAWDANASTIPDTQRDLDAAANSTVSPSMPDSSSIYFHIRASDIAGNWNASAAHLGPFRIDSSPPQNPNSVSSIGHRPGVWSSDRTIEMGWSGADASPSGVDGYSYVWDTLPLTIPPAMASVGADVHNTTSPALADGKMWYFHLRTLDRAGNWAIGAVHSGPYFIDATPPSIRMLAINKGATFTSSHVVALELSAADPIPGSGLGQMRFSLDGGEWSEWKDYSEGSNLTLNGADGPRTVSVQVQDRVNNPGAAGNASIFLDTNAPINVDIKLNGGANWTNITRVVLNISAAEPQPSSGLADMSLSLDGRTWDAWEPFRSTRAWDLESGDGVKKVHLRVRDGAGNIGPADSDDILLDTVAPASLAITIAGGKSTSTSLAVPFQLRAIDPQPASGVGEMAFSEDGAGWTPWEPYSASRGYSFAPGDGTRTLLFKVRDRAMNEAVPAGVTVLVDTTPPMLRSIQVSGVTQGGAVVNWYTDEPSDGMVEYGTTPEYGERLADAAFSTEHSLSITGLAPATDYHLRVGGKDALGNGPAMGQDILFRTRKADDRKAPVVTNVQVDGVTDRSAQVSWDTDEPSDSSVEYGTTTGLGERTANGTYVLRHRMALTGLAAGTVYHFRVASTDPSGNGPGTSAVTSFSTSATRDRLPPRLTNVTVSWATDALAVITWTTDEPATTRVELGRGANYSRIVSSDQYDLRHSMVVAGLLPGTQYHYRAASVDMNGNGPSYSPDATFSTSLYGDSTPPVILGTRLLFVGRDNATIEVTLSEPGSLSVDFGTGKAYGMTAGSPAFHNVHTVRIGHLEPGRTYHYRISATDASGNGPTVGADRTLRTTGAAGAAGNQLGSAPSAILVVVVMALLAVAASRGPLKRR